MKTKTHWLLKIWKEGKEEYWFDTKKRLLRFIRKYNWNGISCTPLIKNWKHCVKKGGHILQGISYRRFQKSKAATMSTRDILNGTP